MYMQHIHDLFFNRKVFRILPLITNAVVNNLKICKCLTVAIVFLNVFYLLCRYLSDILRTRCIADVVCIYLYIYTH